MKCPKCGVEAAIMGTKTKATGDQSPKTQTEVWTVLVYQCRNPGCNEFGKEVGESQHKIYPEEIPLSTP